MAARHEPSRRCPQRALPSPSRLLRRAAVGKPPMMRRINLVQPRNICLRRQGGADGLTDDDVRPFTEPLLALPQCPGGSGSDQRSLPRCGSVAAQSASLACLPRTPSTSCPSTGCGQCGAVVSKGHRSGCSYAARPTAPRSGGRAAHHAAYWLPARRGSRPIMADRSAPELSSAGGRRESSSAL